MTANEAAVKAAMDELGCKVKWPDKPWATCRVAHHSLGQWTERGCPIAVAVADAVVDASAVIKTALDVECPTCDAAPGQDCRAPRTHSPSATHKGRWTVARAMT